MNPFLILFLTIILLIAAINDIRFQKIPNWLNYPTMIMAITYHTVMNGVGGLLFSVEGLGLGIAIWLLPYIMGGMGAGDAKLMGAVGALIGPKEVFIASLFTAVIGGIYALMMLVLHGYLREYTKRYGKMLKTFFLTREIVYLPPHEKKINPQLCYGIAIALGTLTSIFWRYFIE
ncbi:MAG: prepilin peptidase [Pseudomonadota bacterium]